MIPRALMGAAFCAAFAAGPLSACQGPVACPMIAAAPFVTLHISPDRASTLDPASVTATACQDNGCHGGPFELSDEQPPTAGTGPAVPPGKVGHIDMRSLTETPIDLTVSAHDLTGRPLGEYRLQFAPSVDYPWGTTCPRVIIAAATWDNAGLRASAR